MDCCQPYDDFFDLPTAKRSLRRYRRRGLDQTGRRLVELLSARGLAGSSVLEIGAGIGSLQIALLQAGASVVTGLERSSSYIEVADGLLEEAGLTQQAPRMVLEFPERAAEVAPADIVVLNRVVCCFPHGQQLMTAAAGLARHALAFSAPRSRWLVRSVVEIQNWWLRITRSPFRLYVHPPQLLVEAAAPRLVPVGYSKVGSGWEVRILAGPE